MICTYEKYILYSLANQSKFFIFYISRPVLDLTHSAEITFSLTLPILHRKEIEKNMTPSTNVTYR